MASAEEINERNAGSLSGLLGLFGVEVAEVGEGRTESRLTVRPEPPAPNCYPQPASAVALASTSCGREALGNLPENVGGFATAEFKSNVAGAARGGTIGCEAELAHDGRTTQVRVARVAEASYGRATVLFRCPRMIPYPRNPEGAEAGASGS